MVAESALGKGRKGVPLGAPQGAGAEVAVEGGGHRSCSGLSGEHAGRAQGISRGVQVKNGRGQRREGRLEL